MRIPITSMRSAALSAWGVLRRMHEDCALRCRTRIERLQNSKTQDPSI